MNHYQQLTVTEILLVLGKKRHCRDVLAAGGLAQWAAREYTDLVSDYEEQLQELNTRLASMALEENSGWIEFPHAGKEWSFDADQLAEWNAAEDSFHFLDYHKLTDPTIETVITFIDGLLKQ